MILNAMHDKPLPVYGDGLNVRDWIHVEDHCAAIFAVLLEGKPGSVYNVGSDGEMKNIDVVHMILDHLGKPKDLIQFVTDRLGPRPPLRDRFVKNPHGTELETAAPARAGDPRNHRLVSRQSRMVGTSDRPQVKPLKIVIVGSGGRLGAALHRIYSGVYEVTGFNRNDLDLNSSEEIESKLDALSSTCSSIAPR